jgi:hypothetical protein
VDGGFESTPQASICASCRERERKTATGWRVGVMKSGARRRRQEVVGRLSEFFTLCDAAAGSHPALYQRNSRHALNHIVKLIIINHVISMNDSLHIEKSKIKERQTFFQSNFKNHGSIDNDTHHFFTGLGIAIGFSAIFYAVIGVLVWYW